jgi:hypothetical protein
MKRTSVNVNWTEETIQAWTGHASIRNWMIESTNDLNEVRDFNSVRLSSLEKLREHASSRKGVVYVSILEETFELQYKRVFGVSDKTPKVQQAVQTTTTSRRKMALVNILEETFQDAYTKQFGTYDVVSDVEEITWQ